MANELTITNLHAGSTYVTQLSDTCISVFAKSWNSDATKTRLAKSIGQAKTSAIYLAFLDCIANRIGNQFANPIWAVASTQCVADFENHFQGKWPVVVQSNGGLTQRLTQHFAWATEHFNKSIVIGSDNPDIPLGHLTEAAEKLDRFDLVLGPAEDGGYCLIAMKQAYPTLFNQIHWSTENVLEQTIQRVKDLKLKYALLQPWYDVDHVHDLVALRNRLKVQSECAFLDLLAKTIDGVLGDAATQI